MSTAQMNTSLGPITLELFDDDAPKTVENFQTLAGQLLEVGDGLGRVVVEQLEGDRAEAGVLLCS